VYRPHGAGDGIRTRSPLLGKQMRYRCATPACVDTVTVSAFSVKIDSPALTNPVSAAIFIVAMTLIEVR
jgi:hypothetical protein